MIEWIAVLFVGFKLCVLEAGSTRPHDHGWEVWVRPEAVIGIAAVRDQLSGIPCTQIQVGDRTVYVIGSPREVYGKLADAEHQD